MCLVDCIVTGDGPITRLVGAMLLEQNDEWSLNRRYMQLKGLHSLSDTATARVPAVQRRARAPRITALSGLTELHQSAGHDRLPCGATWIRRGRRQVCAAI